MVLAERRAGLGEAVVEVRVADGHERVGDSVAVELVELSAEFFDVFGLGESDDAPTRCLVSEVDDVAPEECSGGAVRALPLGAERGSELVGERVVGGAVEPVVDMCGKDDAAGLLSVGGLGEREDARVCRGLRAVPAVVAGKEVE